MSSSSSRSSGDFPITITARDVGIDQQITKLTRFADVIKTLDAQFKAGMSSMAAYNSAFTNFGKNFTTLNQGFNTGAQGAQRFGQAMQQNVNVLRQGQTTLNQFMNTQKQTVSTTQQAAAAEQNLTANTQRMNQAFSQTSATLGRAQGQLMNLNRNAQQTANTMRNATSQTKMYDAAIFENNNALNQSTTSTENHTKSTKGNTDAIISNMRHISALGMGFMMLSNTMSDSTLVQENIKMQQESLAAAHQRTTKALEEHGKASTQYQQAAAAEAKVARGLAFENREATAQQHNMMFMQAMIASEILSSAVPALLKYKETIAQVSGAFTKLKSVMTATNITNAFSGLSNVLSSIPGKLRNTTVAAGAVGGAMANAESYTMKATKQMGALSTVQPAVAGGFRSMIAAAGPFIAIIAAVGIALAAIATDFMGVRTSLEGLGYSIGEAVPVLYPFLEGLQGIGAQLGLTGESAEQAKQHFENASTGFEHMGELWDQTVSSMQNSSNRMVKAMGDTAAVLGRDITQAAGKLDTQLKATADTWNQFVDALGRGDYKTATDLIISSFEALPGIIFESLKSLGQIVGNAFIGLGNTVGPAIIGIGTELGTRLYDGIIAGITPILAWIQSSIITPIQNFFNGIATGLSNIADAILRALGLTALPQAALTLASAIGKGIMKIVDYASDIADSVWSKLQLNGLVEKATDLAKDIWASITGFFNSASAQSADNIDQGTSPMLTDDQVAEIDKTNKAKAKAIQEQLKRGEKVEGYNTAPRITPTTTTNTNPPGLVSPNNVMSPNNQDYSQFQQAFGSAQQTASKPTPVKSPEPTTKTTTPPPTKSTSPYALDQNSNFIGGGVTAAGSGASQGTHEFIKSQQDAAKSMAPVLTAAEKQKQALDQLEESYKGASGGTNDAAMAGVAFLRTQQNINPAILNNSEQLGKMAVSIGTVSKSNQEMQSTLDGNALAMKNYYLQGLLVESGTLKQKTALQEMQMSLFETKGEIEEYQKQVEDQTITDAAFTQGQQEITKQFLDMQVETAHLNGNYSELSARLNDTNTAQIEYNNGLAKGRVETVQAIINIDAMRGSYDGTRQVLVDTAANMGILNNATALSNDALMNLIEVAKGAPDAIKNLTHWILELGNTMMNDLVSAIHEGSDEFNDAMDEIEDRIGFNLDKDIEMTIKVQADIEDAVNTVKQGLGVMSMLIKAHADPSQLKEVGTDILKNFEDQFEKDGDNIGNGLIDNLKKNYQGRAPEITAIFGQIKTNITTIMNEPIGSEAFNTAFANLQNLFSSLNGDIDNLSQGFAGFRAEIPSATESVNSFTSGMSNLQKVATDSHPWVKAFRDSTNGISTDAGTAATGVNNLAGGISGTGDSAATADPQLQKFYTTVQQFGTIEAVAQVIFEVNIPAHATTMVTKLGEEFNKMPPAAAPAFGTIDSLSQTIFETNVPAHAQVMVSNVQSHFEEMKSNADSTLSDMESRAESSFQAQGESANAFSQGVSKHFSNAKSAGESIIQDLESAVKSSFDAMASAAEKVADAIDSIGESAQQAESDVDSLKSSVESLPNIDRTITYHIETVGSKPSGAQFGTNMLVDKPQMLLVGEGFGKERVKVSPGTMPFAEDFSREMNHKFEVQRSVSGQPGQPGTNANGTSTNNGISISTPGQPGTNGQPGANGQAGISGVNNIYAPGSQGIPTNQSNNPDLGGGGSSGSSMMISNNASLIQMNNSNGKRMIVDGKTGTVIMLDGSQSASNSNTNNSGGGSNSNSNSNGDIVGQNNNVNIDNDSNSKNNVYAPGYTNNVTPPTTTSTGTNGGINQSQTNSQSGSSGGQNYYYQSQTNNGQTSVNSNIPMHPGMINESSSSGAGSMPVSGSYSSDSRSRLLSRGDSMGFNHRIIHETPIEVNIDLEGVKLAKKIIKILTEEMGWGSGFYG